MADLNDRLWSEATSRTAGDRPTNARRTISGIEALRPSPAGTQRRPCCDTSGEIVVMFILHGEGRCGRRCRKRLEIGYQAVGHGLWHDAMWVTCTSCSASAPPGRAVLPPPQGWIVRRTAARASGLWRKEAHDGIGQAAISVRMNIIPAGDAWNAYYPVGAYRRHPI